MARQSPPLFQNVADLELERLIAEWRWLVPTTYTPLFLTRLGDWVFAGPDGSIWCVSSLDGDLRKIAKDAVEYNSNKTSEEWLDENFNSGWYDIAIGNGLIPGPNQCVGWEIHPALGGPFVVSNLKLFDVPVYQSLMGQFHRQRWTASTP